MIVMTRRKQTEPKKSIRSGRAVTLWLPEGLLDAIELFRKRNPPAPTKKAVIAHALKEFLIRRGILEEGKD